MMYCVIWKCKDSWWWPDPWTVIKLMDGYQLPRIGERQRYLLEVYHFQSYIYREKLISLSSSMFPFIEFELISFLCIFKPFKSVRTIAQLHIYSSANLCLLQTIILFGFCFESYQFWKKNDKWIFIYWFYCILATYFKVERDFF